MELQQLFDRAVAIRQASPTATIKQRMAENADALNRAGANQARVEVLNEACLALTTMLYATDPDGRLANIDTRTGRVLVAKPWGSAGWKRWGMRYWEGLILRKILITRTQMRRVPPLFDFSETNQWYLSLHDYPRVDNALIYWKSNPITLRDWRLYADTYREEAQARMNRKRTSGSL